MPRHGNDFAPVTQLTPADEGLLNRCGEPPLDPIGYPFSLETRLLKAMPIACYSCFKVHGMEYALIYGPDIDWEPADEPYVNHWASIGHDPDCKPPYYPIWQHRPVAYTLDHDPIYDFGYDANESQARIKLVLDTMEAKGHLVRVV